MKFDPHLHHRRSIRLKGYDYTLPGAYFVTLCAWQRDCIFGEVAGGEVRLSALGQIVHDEWLRSMEIRREIRLYEDEFVLMPNHVHGIVWIIDVGADGVRPDDGPSVTGVCHTPQLEKDKVSVGADGVRPENAQTVGADGIRPEKIRPDRNHPDGARPDTMGGANLAPLQKAPRSLSSFIAAFKASVSHRARIELGFTGIWQRNYYDHIIRHEKELENIRHYIPNNPQQWGQDQLHPSAPPNPFNQEKQHG